MPAKKNTADFEKNLKELESLVTKMEKGELSLKESLAHFEKGVGLTKNCQKTLAEVEKKIKILLEDDDQQELQSFLSNPPPSDSKK